MRIRISKLLGKTWPWEVTVSSGKCTDVTFKTYLGYLAAQLPWLVDLASFACDMNLWLRCRDTTLQSVGRWFDLLCWRLRYTLLIKPNKGETAAPCVVRRCPADFLVMIIQFTMIFFSLDWPQNKFSLKQVEIFNSLKNLTVHFEILWTLLHKMKYL